MSGAGESRGFVASLFRVTRLSGRFQGEASPSCLHAPGFTPFADLNDDLVGIGRVSTWKHRTFDLSRERQERAAVSMAARRSSSREPPPPIFRSFSINAS